MPTSTNNKRKRRRSRLHEEPQASFWRKYDDETAALLDEEWERGLTPYVPGKFDLDRMLFRARTRFPDFDFITDQVATGGMVKTAEEALVLVEAGITHVVNTASELFDEKDVFEDLGIEYLYNPTRDDFAVKGDEWFKPTLDFAMPALAAGGVVYAHCLEGVNRGPSSAYAILREQGHSLREAYTMLKTARPRAKIAYAMSYEVLHG